MAWTACNNLHKIWVSDLHKYIKLNIFKTLILPKLLYGCETWTVNAKQQKLLDRTYTRLLMRVQSLSWKKHPNKEQIYGNLPPISQLVKKRRVQFAGHCFRASGEMVSSLILWKPESNGRRGHKLTYPDVLAKDTGIRLEDLGEAMGNREVWGGLVNSMVSTDVEQ